MNLHTKKTFFAGVAAAAVLLPFLGTSVNAAGVTYKDYSELNSKTMNGVYSHVSLRYMDNTKITVVNAAGNKKVGDTLDYTENGGVSGITEGEKLTILIEDSEAKDKNNNSIDVLYRIQNVTAWNKDADSTPSTARITFVKELQGSSASSNPKDSETNVMLGSGSPILAWVDTAYADFDLIVEFCKKGSYVSSSDSCTHANIATANAFMYDFDVPVSTENAEKYKSKLFGGNEGVQFNSSSTTVYYNKSNSGNFSFITSDNGIAITSLDTGAGFNGLYYRNSIMVTDSNLANATWKFKYSGTTCGIAFFIGSVLPNDMPAPTKKVNKTTARTGETVTYTINQTVPNNYESEAEIVTFASLYSNFSNIPNSKTYKALQISDTLDESFEVTNAKNIKVVNEKGANVTSYFNIATKGQKITLTAKDLSSKDIYGHTYTITVPAVVKEKVASAKLKNLAHTNYTPTDGNPTDLPSNEVETEIIHTVTTTYIDEETGEELTDPSSKDYSHGDKYDTDEKEFDGYELVAIPNNRSGIVEGDIEVIYRYRKIVVSNPKTSDFGVQAIAAFVAVGLAGGILVNRLMHRR